MTRPILAAFTLALASTTAGFAADNTWTNAGATSLWNLTDANWTSPTIWNNSNTSANVAIFGATGAGPITVANGINARGLSFTANGYTLSGGDITFFNNGSGSVSTGQVSVGTGFSARIDSNLGGAVAFDKVGSGTLELGGTNNFTGTIQIGTGGPLVNYRVGTGSGNVGIVRLLSPGAIQSGASLSVGGGRVELGSDARTFSRLVFESPLVTPGAPVYGIFGTGTLTLTSNRIDVFARNTMQYLEAPIVIASSLDINVGSSIGANSFTLGGSVSGAGAINFNNGIQTNGMPGSGGITLAGNHTYTGGFNLNNTGGDGVVYGSDTAFGTGLISINAVSSLRGRNSRLIANDLALNVASLNLDSTDGRTAFTGSFNLNASGGAVTRTLNVDANDWLTRFTGNMFTSGGSAAVVQTGSGTLEVGGQNTFTGGWTYNAGGTLQLSGSSTGPAGAPTSGPLGTGTLTIGGNANLAAAFAPRTIGNNVVLTGNINFNGSQDLTLSGAINLNTTATNLSRTINVAAGVETIWSGQVFKSGAGVTGLTKAGDGVLVLAGTNNTYDGATLINGGVLAIASEASLGLGSITLGGSNARLRFDQAGTFTRDVTQTSGAGSSGFETNGVDVVFSGTFTRNSATFRKSGAGNLTITTPIIETASTGMTVAGGTLTFAENGASNVGTFVLSVDAGATLVLDNRGVNLANRITDGRNLFLSGDFTFYGNGSANSSESVGSLAAFADGIYVTVVPGAGRSAIINANNAGGALMVVRGDNLGGAAGSGTMSRVALGTFGLTNGLLLGVHASASSTGVGDSLATYDSTTDAAGVVGIRPFRDTEYTVAPTIRNGTGVPNTANFRVVGAVASEANVGGENGLNSLTFTGPGAALSIAPQQMFRLRSQGIMVQADAVDASMTGGRVGLTGGNVLSIYTHGNLTFGSRLDFLDPVNGATLGKYGSGTLRFSANELFNGYSLHVAKGMVDFNGTTQTVRNLSMLAGTTLNLNGGTLVTLDGGALSNAGSIVGSGSLRILGDANGAFPGFTGASTFTGPVEVEMLQGNLFGSSSHSAVLSGNGRWSNATSVEVGPRTTLRFVNDRGFSSSQRLGTSTNLKLVSAGFEYTGTARDAISDTFGTLTLVGGSRMIQPQGGPGATIDFAGLNRTDNGTLRIAVGNNDLGGPTTPYTVHLRFAGGLPTISDPNGPVGGQNTGIVPFLGIEGGFFVGGGGVFATYDASGVRHLKGIDPTVVAQVPANGNLVHFQHRNVALVSNPAAISGSIRVNSLWGNAAVTLTGTGVDPTLGVYSGAIAGSTLNVNGLAIDSGGNTMYLYASNTNVNAGSDLRSTNGVVVAGPSANLNLNNAANSFTGGLYLNNATVNFTSDAQLGAAGGAVVLNGGTLAYSPATAVTLAAGRTLRVGEGHGAVNISNASATMTIDSKISGPGDFYKVGPGTLVLANAANDYGGATALKAGMTRLTADALPSGTKVILGTQNAATAATLDLNGRSAAIGGLQLADANTGGTANLVTNSAGTQSTLTVNGSADSSYAGLFSGDIRFVKSGSGRFTTTAGGAFGSITGPMEVNGGRLVFTGGIASAGTIAVSNTGVLSGTGTVNRAATVSNGGTIAPGASTGLMTFSNGLNLSNGGVYEWEIAALIEGGSDVDQINVNGNLVLGGTSKLLIDVSPLATVGPNSSDPFWNTTRSWSIVSLVGGQNPGNTNFASILNSTFSRGVFSTSVVSGSIFLNFNPSPVPEPSSMALIVAVGVFALLRRRVLRERRCR